MKKSVFYFLLAAGMLQTACSSESETPTPGAGNALRELSVVNDEVAPYDEATYTAELTTEEVELGSALQDFSFRFLKQASAKNDGNVVVSPYGLSELLSMLSNGTGGTSREEMAKALGIEADDLERLNAYNTKTRAQLTKAGSDVKLTSNNAIWMQYDFPVYRSFLANCQNFYGADVQAIDFANDLAGETINKWCANKTNDKITRIVENGPLDFSMLLANALYFLGQWSNPFVAENTTEEKFTNADGKESQAMMMHQTAYMQYAETEMAQLVSKPFGEEQNCEMVIMLPNEGVALDKCMDGMTSASWASATGGMKPERIELSLPRLHVEGDLPLKETLTEMGITSLFDPDKADFSRLSPNPLLLSKIQQNIYLDLDEKGCEAAAVTWAGLVTTSLDKGPEAKIFCANRPFLFVIREKAKGTILFMGMVNEM